MASRSTTPCNSSRIWTRSPNLVGRQHVHPIAAQPANDRPRIVLVREELDLFIHPIWPADAPESWKEYLPSTTAPILRPCENRVRLLSVSFAPFAVKPPHRRA